MYSKPISVTAITYHYMHYCLFDSERRKLHKSTLHLLQYEVADESFVFFTELNAQSNHQLQQAI